MNEKQLQRYERNLLLKNFGKETQEKLLESKVLVIGAGGLGSPVLYYLAAAGVGTIGIADADIVDLSNLQRQIIHSTAKLNKEKVISAKESLLALNPDLMINTYGEYITAENIADTISSYDFVVDATDNFKSKFLINDACILSSKAFSHGGVLGLTGQTMNIIPGSSACYRCVFEKVPPEGSVPTTMDAGILGSVCGILGSIQASEAIKYIANMDSFIGNYLLTFDALTMDFRKIKIKHNKNCPVCGEKPAITKL